MTEQNIAFAHDPATYKELMRGIELAESAIGATLGPAGGTCSIGRHFGRHRPTKDGVTAAKEIQCESWLAQRGVEAVVNGCARQAGVGDGTSSTAVMIAELVRRSIPLLSGGKNGVRLSRELKSAAAHVAEQIELKKGDARLFDVAMTSTNGDEVLARLVSEAVERVGENGIITRRCGVDVEPHVEFAQGASFNLRPVDPAMLMGEEPQLEEASVFTFRGDLSTLPHPLIEAIRPIVGEGRAVILCAHSFSQQVKASLVKMIAGGTKVYALAPDGERVDADEVLLDVAAASGATVLPTATLSTLGGDVISKGVGQLGQLRIGRLDLLALDIPGDVSARVERAQEMAKSASGPAQRKAHNHRAAALASKIAHIYLAAETEGHVGAIMDACEDAILACRAALVSGTVTGGGISLLRARDACPDTDGGRLLRRALARPFLTLVANGNPEGGEPSEYVSGALAVGGFDPIEQQFVDLDDMGIVDPVSVLTGAVKAAVAAAGELIEAKVFIEAYDPKKKG